MKISIVIPIYKEEITKYEAVSLQQCVKVLQKYQIVLVAHKSLNLKNYLDYLTGICYSIEFFRPDFFINISGYNKLMLSKEFYERFEKYDYILIHQLDAFIFNDELSYWSEQNFDYIGAPWFKNHSEGIGQQGLWKVGNGGLSLRKVSSFIGCLKSNIKFPSFNELLGSYRAMPLSLKLSRLRVFYLRFRGFNTINDFINGIEMNEDAFWSILIPRHIKSFSVPDPQTALAFSFECNPRQLYKMNNNQLPFGSHGWVKYDFEFWRPYIEASGYDLR